MELKIKIKKFGHWVGDYFYLAKKHSHAFLRQKPPKHYLDYILENKKPIILIPGVLSKWHFLKEIADPLSLKGYPIYILEHLNYNTDTIHDSAKVIQTFIDEKNLHQVIIIGHSKGGLIGKHLLVYENQDGRISKLIAIATPFGGSRMANIRLIKKFKKLFNILKELLPDSEIIQRLNQEKAVNKNIVSIFGIFDNHVWPEESCRLEGAKNIQVETYGHHKILSDEKVRDIIFNEIEKV